MMTWLSALRVRWLSQEASALGLRRFLAASALTLATAVGAWIAVPVPGSPVPITLQTFVVLAGAGLLGGRLSLQAQLAYVILGGVGLPWFAGGTWGAPMLFGATGGYLIGFLLATWLIGRLLSGPRLRSGVQILGALVLGELVLFACGVAWLGAYLHVSWAKACVLGALPFLPGDLVKVAAAAALIRSAGGRVRRFLA